MDLDRTSTTAFVNPYAKRSAAAASENNDLSNNVATNSVVTDLTMGIQSQLRGGAIKNCKKIATKVNKKRIYKQNAIGGGVAFVAALHCSVCKARRLTAIGKKVSVPHRSHDKRCPMNRKTRGLSKTTVFVNREAQRNIAINTAPLASILGRKIDAESGATIARFFSPACAQLDPKATNVEQPALETDDVVAWNIPQERIPPRFEQKSRSIREVIDDTLAYTQKAT